MTILKRIMDMGTFIVLLIILLMILLLIVIIMCCKSSSDYLGIVIGCMFEEPSE